MGKHPGSVRGELLIINVVAHHASVAVQRAGVDVEEKNLTAQRLGEARRTRGELILDVILADEGLGIDGVQKRLVQLSNQATQV